MNRFLRLLGCMSLVATAACSADAITGPAPAAGAVQAADAVMEEVAPGPAPAAAAPVLIIRCGHSSLAPPGQPVYVIDGVVSTDSETLAQLDANAIEQIEVMKGAQAARIYGSRAVHGVIVITTRSAQPTER